MYVIKKSLIILLVGLRPLLGPANCYFQIGCTQFARIQIETLPLHIATKKIIVRLLLCNPLTSFYRSFVCLKNKQ